MSFWRLPVDRVSTITPAGRDAIAKLRSRPRKERPLKPSPSSQNKSAVDSKPRPKKTPSRRGRRLNYTRPTKQGAVE